MNMIINAKTEINENLLEQIKREAPFNLLKKIVIDYSDHGSLGEDWEPNYDEESLISDFLKETNDEVGGVYIDIKHGEPTTDQVFDAVYGKGAKSRIRIVMYDGNTSDDDRDNPGADYIIVESFVNAINSYGANSFLVKVGLDAEGCVECETIAAPDEIVEPVTAKIPSEDVVRENEFWDLYYWSQQECFFVAHRCLSEGLDEHWEYGIQGEVNDLLWSVQWDESGIFYEIKGESKENDPVKAIWESKKYELQALLPDYKPTFVSKAGILSRIIIHASDLPVRCLMNASLSFKKELARRILAEYGELDQFMQSAADDFNEGKLREVTEFKSLAEVC